ncbi:TetR/AcrR family transcriptional regulator [Metabacillus sp. GX 13764]|uniref:TetR/AcrR family transcriptional regulator n=1 Tax=Metabacillus kandeliae TaxID=2900151 RepID=UPI001E4BE423|nr:TetR/AcrR family transcriptional regulator [Metabacillus kandeliae]MCD7034508.1 TetR/AcrR family transcriptional regulator [Metabacillus kandeliae]
MNKGEKTKQHIIETARKLFAKKGFGAAKTSELAAAAGISEAAIYKYFSGKKELLLACVTPYEEEAGLELGLKELTVKDLLEEYVLAKISWVEKNREQIEILISESLHHPELSEMYLNHIDKPNSYEEEIERRMQQGEMRQTGDFFLFRLALTSSILNILNHKRYQLKKEFDFSEEMRREVVQLVLFGMVGE